MVLIVKFSFKSFWANLKMYFFSEPPMARFHDFRHSLASLGSILEHFGAQLRKSKHYAPLGPKKKEALAPRFAFACCANLFNEWSQSAGLCSVLLDELHLTFVLQNQSSGRHEVRWWWMEVTKTFQIF